MEIVQKDTVVQINFSLHTTTGELVDAESGFSYLHGYNKILSGMEGVLEGKSKGESIHIELSPEEAFGKYVKQEPIRVHRRDFGKGFDRLYKGMGIPVKNSDGEEIVIYVQKKDGSYVSLSRNHPLAGISLIFDANILDVRCATSEEIMNKMIIDARGGGNAGSCSCC